MTYVKLSQAELALINQYRVMPVECQDMLLRFAVSYVAKYVHWSNSAKGGV